MNKVDIELNLVNRISFCHEARENHLTIIWKNPITKNVKFFCWNKKNPFKSHFGRTWKSPAEWWFSV